MCGDFHHGPGCRANSYGTRIVAVGGTGSGADTAAVIMPAHASNVFDLKVEEILCKPSRW